MINKLKRSKLWSMLVADASGTVTMLAGAVGMDGEEVAIRIVAILAGAAVSIAATLGYIRTEGEIDKEAVSRGR